MLQNSMFIIPDEDEDDESECGDEAALVVEGVVHDEGGEGHEDHQVDEDGAGAGGEDGVAEVAEGAEPAVGDVLAGLGPGEAGEERLDGLEVEDSGVEGEGEQDEESEPVAPVHGAVLLL